MFEGRYHRRPVLKLHEIRAQLHKSALRGEQFGAQWHLGPGTFVPATKNGRHAVLASRPQCFGGSAKKDWPAFPPASPLATVGYRRPDRRGVRT